MDSTINSGEAMSEDSTTKSNTNKKTELELKSLGEYNREVSKELPKEIFKKDPLRLKYLVFYSFCIFVCGYILITQPLAWFFKLPISIFMGICLAGNTFLAHETLHGSVVRNKKLQHLVGFLGLTPFMISPTYWRFWHNTLHHGNTQLLYKDPDAFPTKMVWKRSKFMQFVFPLSPGSGYLRSYFYFFYWFSFQAVLNQAYMRFGNKMWDKMDHKKVTREFAIALVTVTIYITAVGPSNWLWLVIVPFLAQNYTVMSYISTNHNVSPLTKINDPLVNSLTVTNNPIMEFLNLNFGYHTEHHLFPSMPASQAKKVSKKLKEMYPDRYMIMPKSKAMKLLYSTARIYKNRDTLVNPETGKEYPTLGKDQ